MAARSKVRPFAPNASATASISTTLTPLYPDRKINLELQDPTKKGMSQRVIEMVSPLGFVQRALIVAPPRTGKTIHSEWK